MGRRSAKLPRISTCDNVRTAKHVSSVRGRLGQSVFAFLVLAMLAVAHVYLRFSIADLRLQQSQLQVRHRERAQVENRLIHENEALCDAQRMRDFARRELHMEESDPRTRVVMVLPDELRTKYTARSGAGGATAASLRALAASADEKVQGTAQRLLMALLDMNKAFASSPDEPKGGAQ